MSAPGQKQTFSEFAATSAKCQEQTSAALGAEIAALQVPSIWRSPRVTNIEPTPADAF